MEVLVVVLAILSAFSQGAALAQIWRLAREVRTPGIGRILFVTLMSFKIWSLIMIAYFVTNSLIPGFFGENVNSPTRVSIRLFLVLYLVWQPVLLNIAIYRWRKRG